MADTNELRVETVRLLDAEPMALAGDDTTPPRLVSYPGSGVLRIGGAYISFSEAMAESTFTPAAFTITNAVGEFVAIATVEAAYPATAYLTFDPPLTKGRYTFNLNSQVKDLAGNSIDPGTSFIFTVDLNIGTPFDFDGDRGPELLYYSTTDSRLRMLDGDGSPAGGFGVVPAGGVIAVGDYLGYIWQDVTVLYGNGSLRSYSGRDGNLITSYGDRSNYDIIAVKDFDHDGGKDLLLQRDDGLLQVFDGNGSFQKGFGKHALGAVAAVGDVNSDGVFDLILVLPSGAYRAISGDDGHVIANYGRSGWTLLALDDFDGDVGEDLLFQRPDGATQIVNGEGGLQQGLGVNPVGSIIATGDLDGDYASDVIMRLDDRTVRSYSGTDGSVISSYGDRTDWTLIALADFDNDGGKDLLFQRNSDGRIIAQDGDGGLLRFFGDHPVGGVEQIGDFDRNKIPDLLIRDTANSLHSHSGYDGSVTADFGNFYDKVLIGGLPDLLNLGFDGVLV